MDKSHKAVEILMEHYYKLAGEIAALELARVVAENNEDVKKSFDAALFMRSMFTGNFVRDSSQWSNPQIDELIEFAKIINHLSDWIKSDLHTTSTKKEAHL